MQARGRWQSEHCWADYRMLSQTDSAGLTCVRFSVRTFQRRVQQWRGIMANQLVYVASETTPLHCGGIPSVALTVGAPGAEFSVTFLPQ